MTESVAELLYKIHNISLGILLVFDKVCRENELTYFLDSGTALGAVRHGGFIPWDDDIDVGMPRKDYERFLEIAQAQLPEEIFLQTHETDPAYERGAAKLRLKGTIFQEYNDLPYKENGFFIDIFPFDNVPHNKFAAKIYIITLGWICRVVNSWYSRKESQSKFKRTFQLAIKIVPKSCIDFLYKKHEKYCRKYENRETGYMTCHFWGMTFIDGNTYIFDKDRMLPVKEISFEGYNLKIVREPDYYLSLMYGDYMQLPPEEKRHGHHLQGTIDFGDYS